ncbi:MAG TPA: hypothetical protein VG796_22720 [Verrucomicrobiales bacterium]|jgi:hypothetical protein|nr:hypothetical protein [Verrucomicrobiales bacterium]
MYPRLITAVIFLFCGTMTTLLVRSVLYPEDSKLATADPGIPFGLFASRTEGSSLDIWDANKIIGNCRITPSGSAFGLKGQKKRVKVRVEVLIRLGREIMGSSLVDITAELWLHSDGDLELQSDGAGEIDRPPLRLTLHAPKPEIPEIRLTVSQPEGGKPPVLELTRGNLTLFKSSAGLNPGDINGQLAGALLQSAGVPPEALAAKDTREKSTSTVRKGHIEAGGESFDGFVLSTGSDEDTRFSLYLSNTGEILRIHTPLSGKNELGLRLLSETLAPKNVDRPDLEKEKYRIFSPKKKPSAK